MSDAQVDVIVPGNHLMVGLLGQRDEFLRAIEASFPDTSRPRARQRDHHRRREAEQVGRLFEELVLLLQQGQPLDSASLGRTIDMVQADERPSEVLTAEILRGAKGRTVRPKTSGQKRYVDAIRQQRDHLRPRAGRHRQELAGRGHGGAGAAGQGGRSASS